MTRRPRARGAVLPECQGFELRRLARGSKRVRLPSMDSGRPTVSIVVTGDVGAGKTCLIRRYVNNYFPKGSQKSTSSKKRLGLEHSLKVSLRYYWVRCRSVENNRSSQQLKRWASSWSCFKLLMMKTLLAPCYLNCFFKVLLSGSTWRQLRIPSERLLSESKRRNYVL